ncbi:hypothetical protein [Coprococcus sp. AM100_B19A]
MTKKMIEEQERANNELGR